MYFNIRLLELIKYLGENPTSFGKKLKSSTAENIRRMTLNEKANPGLEILSEIITLYPQVNPSWLLTGTGSMIIDSKSPKNYSQIESINFSDDPKVTTYSCPDCITKEREIKLLQQTIEALNELLNKYRSESKKEIPPTSGKKAG